MIMTAPNVHRLSLEFLLQCPRCGQLVGRRDGPALAPDAFTGVLKCHKNHCQAHWWANRFDAGDIREQLLKAFEGDAELVDQMMTLFGLPERIDEPRFWQVLLSGQQFHRYHTPTSAAPPSLRGRSIALLRGVVSFLQRA